MEKGMRVYTPRFCTVTISEVFENRKEASRAGYNEPTYYDKAPGYEVVGKALDMYHMEFAAYKK